MRSLLVGLPAVLLCLVLQAVFVTLSLRYYARIRQMRLNRKSPWVEIALLATAMLVNLLGNFAQMAIWAVLFRLLGQFDDFSTALYHSAVNFVTLGYGDIVMTERWRMLGPLEGANGILMFGVSTAVMTAAVMDVLKYNRAGHDHSEPQSPDTNEVRRMPAG